MDSPEPAETVGQQRVRYELVLRRDPCSYCGLLPRRSKWEPHPRMPGSRRRNIPTVDHIVPTAGGGPNEWENLTGACAWCNNRKSASSLLDFLLHLLSANLPT